MTNLKYDKTLSTTIGHEKIKYGILFGNEKIVFIKVGADGNIRGYQDKYLRMAHRVHDRIGATVICASNSDLSGKTQLKVDKTLIEKVIVDLGLDHYELCFVGNSDGGDHSLKLSQQFPETVKFLGINSSWTSIDDFLERIQSLPSVKKIFAYGANDIDFDDILPKLQSLVCDNLEIVVLDGVDHDFTGKVDDFISLIDLL
jgi:alpha/beta superfamily hydrolase